MKTPQIWTFLLCIWNCDVTEKSDVGSHLAEVRRRSWRRAPAAGSPGVGGGARCVPSLASRRPPAALLPRACSPRVSAALRCAPRTPCWSYAAAASQLHVLRRDTQKNARRDWNNGRSEEVRSRETVQRDTAIGPTSIFYLPREVCSF